MSVTVDDRRLIRELTRCGVQVLPGSPIVGTLRGFTFRFHNYYWVVDGRMPLDVAMRLYAHPVGKTDIRSGGHCGCLSPEKYGADYFDSEGNQLYSDPEGKEAKSMAGLMQRGLLPADSAAHIRFVPDKRIGYTSAYVNCYHVDSELGLYVLTEAIRALPV
jgi:hypothetical protein